MSCGQTFEAIKAEISRWPVSCKFKQRGRHPSVVLSFAGKERFVVFTKTRTCRRGTLNAVALVRRTCRDLTSEVLPDRS